MDGKREKGEDDGKRKGSRIKMNSLIPHGRRRRKRQRWKGRTKRKKGTRGK